MNFINGTFVWQAMREIDIGMTFILVGAFLLIMGLAGVNLFIALLSNVVESVDEASHSNAVLQRVSAQSKPLKMHLTIT